MGDSGRRELSTEEVAALAGLAPNTIRARFDDGTLPGHRLPAPAGRKRRGNLVFEWPDVAAFLRAMGRPAVHPDDVQQ